VSQPTSRRTGSSYAAGLFFWFMFVSFFSVHVCLFLKIDELMDSFDDEGEEEEEGENEEQLKSFKQKSKKKVKKSNKHE